MKILLLAPQPFYMDRGTPIAVNLLIKVLSQRGEEIDMVTYHLGEDVDYENVTIHRIINLPFIRSISPGFSFQKLICDFFFFWKAAGLLSMNRYLVIHAVEEAAFMAFIFKKVWGTDYIYDMDSKLSAQLINKHPSIGPLKRLFQYLEKKIVRDAILILPVSYGLVEDFDDLSMEKVFELHDVSLLSNGAGQYTGSIKEGMDSSELLVMYVGNLEKYQGIDLLLESFVHVASKINNIHLAIIGGKPADIRKYKAVAKDIGIASVVRFLGPKPVENLGGYLSEADILVSPRNSGTNTPMKLYSFLDSGKAIVATNLRTHTQVLDKQVAILADPNPMDFSSAILLAAGDERLRQELGTKAKQLAQEKYTYDGFQSSVNQIYDSIDPILAN